MKQGERLPDLWSLPAALGLETRHAFFALSRRKGSDP